ncbi:MAG TPA: prepilin-type N-terminal cleavage/methylation domain-containing protein [Methylotenera sp.]|nr:prepilin-type N-terminal cleavage/methylation domain-containing protein [Methylotenera sp.]
MLNQDMIRQTRQAGTTLIEVLVTVVILAFGLLGLAGLEMKTRSVEMESYQRSQAMVILNDMVNRLQMARGNAADYVADGALVGDSEGDCNGKAGAAFDLCEWGNALIGAGETLGASKVGAMIGARGCITEIQTPDNTPGACTPGIYEITVTWQGMFKTKAPSNACAENTYGDDSLRRAISLRVSAGTGSCV